MVVLLHHLVDELFEAFWCCSFRPIDGSKITFRLRTTGAPSSSPSLPGVVDNEDDDNEDDEDEDDEDDDAIASSFPPPSPTPPQSSSWGPLGPSFPSPR